MSENLYQVPFWQNGRINKREGKKEMYKVKMEHSSTATWHIIQVQTIANQFL